VRLRQLCTVLLVAVALGPHAASAAEPSGGEKRIALVIGNADYAAGFPDAFAGSEPRGTSDHDPQVVRFRSRPFISVADASVAEGNSGTTPLTFTVTLSRPLSEDGLVCAATVDVTARHGEDYDPLFACATVHPGVTSVTFTVGVRGDRRRERDEQFLLVVVGDPRFRYTDPIAVGTIVNDD